MVLLRNLFKFVLKRVINLMEVVLGKIWEIQMYLSLLTFKKEEKYLESPYVKARSMQYQDKTI